MADARGVALARFVAAELRRIDDPEAVLGTLIPILLALAVEYLGRDQVRAELEAMLDDWPSH